MLKRGNFYPDGTFIPYQMPNDFRKSVGKEACGNCGMYSEEKIILRCIPNCRCQR